MVVNPEALFMVTRKWGQYFFEIIFHLNVVNNEWFNLWYKKKFVQVLVRIKKGSTFAIPLDEKAGKKAFG
ncbi:MAG: hypothetical protein FD166_3422 [Bacteroidetes bacterium]|nr:MAG: hypothetical protein FD166_3422 [Bacteroidota bacterium]